jgi:hypothetical protein
MVKAKVRAWLQPISSTFDGRDFQGSAPRHRAALQHDRCSPGPPGGEYTPASLSPRCTNAHTHQYMLFFPVINARAYIFPLVVYYTHLARKPTAPSPLLQHLLSSHPPSLCTHRGSLTSLILASKFTRDKCYSNRAWAKLSGLPPREIGRCEHALGDALEWRLWVGKPIPPPTSTSPPLGAPRPRTVVRSHSDGDLISGSKASLGWTASLPSMGSSLPSSPALTRSKDPPLSHVPIINLLVRRLSLYTETLLLNLHHPAIITALHSRVAYYMYYIGCRLM